MKQEALSYFTDTHLTIIGLFIFLAYFVIITAKALFLNKKEVELFSNLPLENECEVSNEPR